MKIYRKFGKRVFDLVVVIPLLIVFCPLIIIVAIVVRIQMSSPVIFRQERPGLSDKPFEALKFRTMTDRRDAEGNLLPEKERLTSLGKFIRKLSLDELPQLWNVLRGDMSLVGPRPLLMSYLPYYTEREATRHSVRPGITGLAQSSGRNTVDWNRRFVSGLSRVWAAW